LQEPAVLLERFRAAYEKAHRQPAPECDYSRGWFRIFIFVYRAIEGKYIRYTKKAYRRKEFLAWIEELERR
jgi:hypothetical protein